MDKLVLIYNCCEQLYLVLIDQEVNLDLFQLCLSLNGLIVNYNNDEYDQRLIDKFLDLDLKKFAGYIEFSQEKKCFIDQSKQTDRNINFLFRSSVLFMQFVYIEFPP